MLTSLFYKPQTIHTHTHTFRHPNTGIMFLCSHLTHLEFWLSKVILHLELYSWYINLECSPLSTLKTLSPQLGLSILLYPPCTLWPISLSFHSLEHLFSHVWNYALHSYNIFFSLHYIHNWPLYSSRVPISNPKFITLGILPSHTHIQ